MEAAQVKAWLDRYVASWESYDPSAIGDLFAQGAEYRYHPWDDPVVGRDAIVADWLAERDEPGSFEARYEPFVVSGDTAVATGRSTYLENGDVTKVYENCYLLRFDPDGRCTSFVEYFMKRP